MKIVLVGCGHYGQVYLSYIRHHTNFDVVGFLDDADALMGSVIRGVPIIGTTRDLSKIKRMGVDGIMAPLGDNRARVSILTSAHNEGFDILNFIHPSAIVSEDAQVGRGVYILPGCVVMPYADIRDMVMISMGVKVAHHTILSPGVFLSSGVNVGANIHVAECAFVGIGATIMTGVKLIGAHAVIGAGAVVIRDVAQAATVAGVPAKLLKQS